MTTDVKAKFTELFNELASEKTFSVAALEVMNKIKAENESLIAQNERQANELREQRNLTDTYRQEVKVQQDLVSNLSTQLELLRKKEADANAAILQKAVAEASAAAFKFALETIFRPVTLREMTSKSVPLSNNGMVSTWTESETKTTEKL